MTTGEIVAAVVFATLMVAWDVYETHHGLKAGKFREGSKLGKTPKAIAIGGVVVVAALATISFTLPHLSPAAVFALVMVGGWRGFLAARNRKLRGKAES